VQYFKQVLPTQGTSLKEIHNTTHNLLDEICPNTFDEMRQNDGIGSDNMTVIIVDFLQNSGGANAKAANVSTAKATSSKTVTAGKPSGYKSYGRK